MTILQDHGLITITLNKQEFQTIDVFEGVAFLMKYKKFENMPFWTIKIHDEDKELINPVRALYWLSGGDNFWVDNNDLKIEWSECNELYYNHFSAKIYEAVDKCNTLMDIRKYILNNLNLVKFWDFALSKKIIAFS